MDPTELDDMELHHVAPIGQDTIPDQNQAHYCMSCDFPMNGLYCVQCGQKNDDYRRSIFTLIKEFITSITAIESRIWRTWLALLFKPGKVARQYSNGRRAYWSSPIRVYLAMSILLFGYMGITNTHLFSIDIDAKVKDGIEKPLDELEQSDIDHDFNIHAFETQASIDERNKNRNFELIQKMLEEGWMMFNLNVSPTGITASNPELTEEAREEAKERLEELKVTLPDGAKGFIEDVEGMVDQAEENAADGTEGPNVVLNGQKVESKDWIDFTTRFMRNPAALTQSFNKWLPRLMFFMMPFTMLIGALFIRGRGNAILYDHLVHAAYIHAVAFFLLFLGIVLSRFISGDAVANLIAIVLLIYLPLSLKQMFQRGWIKTVWTAYGVGFIYMIILFLGMLFFIVRDMSSTFMSTL